MHRLYYALPSKSFESFPVVWSSGWNGDQWMRLCMIHHIGHMMLHNLWVYSNRQSAYTVTFHHYGQLVWRFWWCFEGYSASRSYVGYDWGVNPNFRFRWYVPLPWERKILGELWLEICSWFHGSVNVTQYWRKLILQWKTIVLHHFLCF